MIWCSLKRLLRTKSENLNNRCDQILFKAPLVMSIDMDVNMVAVVGQCPLAQVLRNSLSVHPPTTGTKLKLSLRARALVR